MTPKCVMHIQLLSVVKLPICIEIRGKYDISEDITATVIMNDIISMFVFVK